MDNWEIVERSPAHGRMVAVEVSINKWLYNAILAATSAFQVALSADFTSSLVSTAATRRNGRSAWRCSTKKAARKQLW
jgi:hypothetical protein